MEFQGDDITELIDCSIFSDELHAGVGLLTPDHPVSDDPSSGDTSSNPSLSSASSWIDELENLLMQEDDTVATSEATKDFCDTFLADILVDCSKEGAGELVDSPLFMIPSASDDGKVNYSDKEDLNKADVNDEKSEEGDANDPISKKRRRQLRNRDAALRSRERKKSYVKDLEMKNRYLEGECRRLGRLLQCCYAENQALRHNLRMGFVSGASLAKQESAVLLLESLLLGSLLWLMGAMCLFTLPQTTQPILEPVPQQKAAGGLEKVGSSGGGSEDLDQSFARSRRCKSARIKMRPFLLVT